MITTTEPALCTSAPTTGFRIPAMARTIARRFNPMEKLRLHLIVIIIRLDKAIRCGSSLSKMLIRSAAAEITRNRMSLLVPPNSRSSSSLSVIFVTLFLFLYTYMGICCQYIISIFKKICKKIKAWAYHSFYFMFMRFFCGKQLYNHIDYI